MKRNFYFLIPFLLSGGHTFAQISIGAENFPEIGATFTVTSYDYEEGVEGESGADKVWDLSGVSGETPAGNFEFLDPAKTPFAADFPQADIAMLESNSGIYVFEKRSGEDIYRQGSALSINYMGATVVSKTKYTVPHILVDYPIEYGNTENALMNGTTYSTYGDITREGDLSYEVDGYGTLILPDGSSHEALRVIYRQDITDAYDGGTATNTRTTTYGFYVKEYKYQAVSIHKIVQETVVMGIVLDSEKSDVVLWARPSNATSLADAAASDKFSVYPNPASDWIQVKAPGHRFISGADIQLLNSDGQIVWQGSYNDGERINISGFASGLYLLTVRDDSRYYSEKVVIR